MATISSSIQLYDRVSAPLNNMISALDSMVSAFENVDSSMADGFNTAPINSARQAIAAAQEQVVRLGEEQDDYTEKVKKSGSAADGLLGKIGGLVAAYGGMQLVSKAVNLSDTMTQTTARLNMMNDGLQTTEELQQMIFQSAQRSRGSYQDSADAVAKMGIMAKDAFNSNAELVGFVEQLNKQFTIAGTSQEGVSAAMLQLTQAMSSGVLRGEELNSVFEQAPTIIQAIADHLGVPIGKIREMAAEGQISSEIVKTALLSAADETNAKFEQMPMTWGQVFTSMQNQALMAFQPVLDKINEIANSEKFQNMANGLVGAFSMVSNIIVGIMEVSGMVVSFIAENWSIIEPIIMGIVTALGLYYGAMLLYNTITGISTAITNAKAFMDTVHAASLAMQTGATFAATAAQHGFNAALLACPLTWILLIIIAVIAIIYAVIAAINKCAGTTISATGVIFGVISAAVSAIWNIFVMLVTFILKSVILPITTHWDNFANFFGNLFNDPVAAIIRVFEKLADTVLSILQTIAKGIDAIFGSNLAGVVQGWRDGISGKADELVEKYGNGTYEEKSNVTDQINTMLDGLQDKVSLPTIGESYKWGYGVGEGIDDKVSGLFSGGGMNDLLGGGLDSLGAGYDSGNVPGNIADTAENTGKAADSLEITKEDLKYLNDLAEREVINRFTTAEIKVDMTNNNNVSSNMDLDGMVDHLANTLTEAMEKTAEGVHV